MNSTLSKQERLHSKKQIEILFARGDSFFKYPFKVVFTKEQTEKTLPVQLLVSVSKRNFKNAVDRNKIKRLIREAYRKNKHILYNKPVDPISVLFLGLIYTPKTILEYKEIEKKIILILHRLIKGDAETAR